jgi:hypothetical protein
VGRWKGYSGALAARPERMEGCPAWLGPLGRGVFWICLFDVVMFVFATLTLCCFGWRNLVAAFRPMDAQDVIDFARQVHLSDGVSPLLPRVFFCVALFGWGVCLVRQQYLAKTYAFRCPFPEGAPPALGRLVQLDKEVGSELTPPSTIQNHFLGCVGVFVLAAIIFCKLFHDSIPPVDGMWYGRITLLGFFVGSCLLLITLLQFGFAWRRLRKLLHRLALLPMQNAFQRLCETVVTGFDHYLFSLRESLPAAVGQQSHRLASLFPAFRAELKRVVEAEQPPGQLDHRSLSKVWEEVTTLFGNELKPLSPAQGANHPSVTFPAPAAGNPTPAAANPTPAASPTSAAANPTPAGVKTPARGPWPVRFFRSLWRAVSWAFLAAVRWLFSAPGVRPEPTDPTVEGSRQLAENCLRVLRFFWPAHTMEEAFGRPPRARPQTAGASFLSLPADHPIREWAVAAEDFVALVIVRYLGQFIVQLRTLLTSLTLGSLLLVLAASVYPFFPQHQLLLFLTILAGATAAAIVWFLVQLNRDELISRISRSTPNRFTPDLSFVQAAAAYVLPIVAGLMIQFPIITSGIRSLIDPLFHLIT